MHAVTNSNFCNPGIWRWKPANWIEVVLSCARHVYCNFLGRDLWNLKDFMVRLRRYPIEKDHEKKIWLNNCNFLANSQLPGRIFLMIFKHALISTVYIVFYNSIITVLEAGRTDLKISFLLLPFKLKFKMFS